MLVYVCVCTVHVSFSVQHCPTRDAQQQVPHVPLRPDCDVAPLLLAIADARAERNLGEAARKLEITILCFLFVLLAFFIKNGHFPFYDHDSCRHLFLFVFSRALTCSCIRTSVNLKIFPQAATALRRWA